MIEKYEAQDSKEARFVKFVDKIMPEITHALNDISFMKESGKGKEFYLNFNKQKIESLESLYFLDFPEVFDIYKSVSLISKDLYIKNLN